MHTQQNRRVFGAFIDVMYAQVSPIMGFDIGVMCRVRVVRQVCKTLIGGSKYFHCLSTGCRPLWLQLMIGHDGLVDTQTYALVMVIALSSLEAAMPQRAISALPPARVALACSARAAWS